jgi:hypothetical protein
MGIPTGNIKLNPNRLCGFGDGVGTDMLPNSAFILFPSGKEMLQFDYYSTIWRPVLPVRRSLWQGYTGIYSAPCVPCSIILFHTQLTVKLNYMLKTRTL